NRGRQGGQGKVPGMARVGGRQARLLVGVLLPALAGMLWVGAGVAHANCDPNLGPVDPTMCGGDMGGGSNNTPPPPPPDNQSSNSQSSTNSQQSSGGPQVNVQPPHEQPATPKYQPPVQKKVYTPTYEAPAVAGSDFSPALPDAPP